ncbi:MAG: SpoIIE family protein phosphatase [Bacillota bacterium]|nr:SpoIIE family protein phosphatase [Bacillota bacterium]
MWKQTIIGVIFGIVAILATEFGIPVDGAVLNVRNAAPLTAGLVFGWPAGIISGVIGGVERWVSNAGDYTRLACSISTVLAGLVGAAVRKFMNDNKKATWFYGLAVGITVEVFHMLMVFLTNSDDIQRAFEVVQTCAIPMILANSISVMLSIMVITFLVKHSKSYVKTVKEQENIAQTFRRWLLICVILAFGATTLFSHSFQTNIAYHNAESTLKTTLDDICNDVNDLSDRNLLRATEGIVEGLPDDREATREDLLELAKQYEVTEISIVNDEGYITVSTDPVLYGFDMALGKQSAEFLALLRGQESLVQEYQPVSRVSSIYRKYAGVAIDGGFVQAGYDTDDFKNHIHEQVKYITHNRRIGHYGNVIVCDENGTIVSDREGHEGENISIYGDSDALKTEPEKCFAAEMNGKPSLLMYTQTEGYYIIGIMNENEALLSKRASIYMLAFMELLVFALLFAMIFMLIKKLVVRNIQKINESLTQITNGDLEVTVDVRDNEEFASLSDDINTTVATLKQYIEEAAARFDKDLEIAKTIQHSALPTVFPPYPNRKDFSIFASMDAAKEVGGDFYDFYMLDEDHIAFVIADVSGKGIPGAMFMMTSKTLIKSHAESGIPVDEVFNQVNTQLCENNDAEMFVTAWLGVLDLETGLVKYVNAGHNPPAIKRKDGTYEFAKGRANFVLAGMDGIKYKEQQIQLRPGDEIYLYTDGITEAHDQDNMLFGDDRLLASLNSTDGMDVDEICKKVKSDVDAFVGITEQFDDITMLCIRLNEVEEMMLTLKPTLESMPEAAAFVEENLEKLEVPVKYIMKLMVAVDEIYSNIIRYSGATEAEIRIRKEGDDLRITFVDNGKPYNPLEAEEPDVTASAEDRAIGGLGIYMVRNMMDKTEYMYKDNKNILILTLEV